MEINAFLWLAFISYAIAIYILLQFLALYYPFVTKEHTKHRNPLLKIIYIELNCLDKQNKAWMYYIVS